MTRYTKSIEACINYILEHENDDYVDQLEENDVDELDNHIYYHALRADLELDCILEEPANEPPLKMYASEMLKVLEEIENDLLEAGYNADAKQLTIVQSVLRKAKGL